MKLYYSQMLESEKWDLYNQTKIKKLLNCIQEIMEQPLLTLKDMSPLEQLLYLLQHIDNERLLNVLSFYLKEFPVNDKILIYHLGHLLCKCNSIKKRRRMMQSFSEILGNDIHFINKGYQFRTKYGKIDVYRANEVINDPNLLKLCGNLPLQDSHVVMSLLAPQMKDETIVSCLMPQLFDGYSYQAFVYLKQGYLDFIHNCFYEESMFNEIYQPKILVKIQGKELMEIPPLLKVAYRNKNRKEE